MELKIEPYKGISVIYDEIRPSYPEKLIDDVISKTEINHSHSLLEIGAGTGKATLQFAEKGFRIQAVELGEDMAEILRAKCSNYENVTVDVASFEQWNPPQNQTYDMIYSAQAFHWLDSNIKYKKCHNLLKDNGYLVLFWYNPCDDELPITREIEDKVSKIVASYGSSFSLAKGTPERRKHDGVSNEDERKAEIQASDVFELVEKLEYMHETKNNIDQYLKVIKSIPAFASFLDGLDNQTIVRMDNEIKELINSYGGYVSTFLKFSLYITKKIN
jgi:SAM-dependent methyltransferase